MSDSFMSPWTIGHQAPLTMGFSRQEYWRGLPFPSPGDLPDSGVEPMSPALIGRLFRATRKPFIPFVCTSLQAFSVLPNVDSFKVSELFYRLSFSWVGLMVSSWLDSCWMLFTGKKKKLAILCPSQPFMLKAYDEALSHHWWCKVSSLMKLPQIPPL